MAVRAKGFAMRDSVFIYSPSYQTYMFHQEHPFNQQRVLLTYDLLKTINAFGDGDIVSPRLAEEEELALSIRTIIFRRSSLRARESFPLKKEKATGSAQRIHLSLPACTKRHHS